nr:hypothetical protein CFP56_11957 [Quercus suber]
MAECTERHFPKTKASFGDPGLRRVTRSDTETANLPINASILCAPKFRFNMHGWKNVSWHNRDLTSFVTSQVMKHDKDAFTERFPSSDTTYIACPRKEVVQLPYGWESVVAIICAWQSAENKVWSLTPTPMPSRHSLVELSACCFTRQKASLAVFSWLAHPESKDCDGCNATGGSTIRCNVHLAVHFDCFLSWITSLSAIHNRSRAQSHPCTFVCCGRALDHIRTTPKRQDIVSS